MNRFTIELGATVEDRISGFRGVVTGRAEYISGCRQYCVVPPAKDGELKGVLWFDEDRLETVDAPKVVLARPAAVEPPPGGPQACPAPTK